VNLNDDVEYILKESTFDALVDEAPLSPSQMDSYSPGST